MNLERQNSLNEAVGLEHFILQVTKLLNLIVEIAQLLHRFI